HRPPKSNATAMTSRPICAIGTPSQPRLVAHCFVPAQAAAQAGPFGSLLIQQTIQRFFRGKDFSWFEASMAASPRKPAAHAPRGFLAPDVGGLAPAGEAIDVPRDWPAAFRRVVLEKPVPDTVEPGHGLVAPMCVKWLHKLLADLLGRPFQFLPVGW